MEPSISAAALGGIASALRYTKNGCTHFVQVLLSSACLAYFVGPEIIRLSHQHFGISVSVGAVYFLTAYFGTEILNKIATSIKALQVTKKWK
jgi:hypothetical protein